MHFRILFEKLFKYLHFCILADKIYKKEGKKTSGFINVSSTNKKKIKTNSFKPFVYLKSTSFNQHTINFFLKNFPFLFLFAHQQHQYHAILPSQITITTQRVPNWSKTKVGGRSKTITTTSTVPLWITLSATAWTTTRTTGRTRYARSRKFAGSISSQCRWWWPTWLATSTGRTNCEQTLSRCEAWTPLQPAWFIWMIWQFSARGWNTSPTTSSAWPTCRFATRFQRPKTPKVIYYHLWQMKLYNRNFPVGERIEYMGWVNEGVLNSQISWQTYKPRFLVLKGTEVLLFDNPPLNIVMLSKPAVAYKVYQTMFRVVKESETVDSRQHCFLLQSSGQDPRYLSVETRQELLRIENSWNAAIVTSVIKLGVRKFQFRKTFLS